MFRFFENRWAVFFFILPQLGIYFFRLFPSVLTIIQVWQLLILIPVVFAVRFRINTFNLLIFFSSLLILASTIVNHDTTSGTIFNLATWCGFCFYLSNATRNFKELITGLYFLFTTIIIVNFLTMILPAFRLEGYYLVGSKNGVQLILLPAIAVVYLYTFYMYNKMKRVPFMLIVISIISLYLSGSGTATVIAILTLPLTLLPKKILPNMNTYLFLYTISFLSLVIFRLQNIFANFIIFVLHKDLTLTGRTLIWDVVLQHLQGNWILGLGRENPFLLAYFPDVTATHNGILEVIVFSGVIGLALFIFILLSIGKKMKAFRHRPIAKILSFFVFAYMVIGLTESVFYLTEFWLLLALSYDVDRIIKQVKPKEEQTVNDINHEPLSAKVI